MKAVSIASGSKGNCIYIESGNTCILIDNGLSLKNLEGKLALLNINPNNIDAILLTHEHSDHLYGVKAFLNKYKKTKIYIPSYVQNFCLPGIIALPSSQIEWYSSSDFFVKDITVSSFILPHDSHFCVGYSLLFGGKKVSIATDLGVMSNQTLNCLSNSDVLFIESNHDENLLRNNVKYTARLKKRILSSQGHLSNKNCAEALVQLVKTGVKQVVLSHISQENNTPLLAYNTVKQILGNNGIIEGDNVFVDVAVQDSIGTFFDF